MAENLSTALQITVIGMGLVFGGILILWGLMSLLLRFTTSEETTPEKETQETAVSSDNDVIEQKRRVAALAVAIALAHEHDDQKPQPFPMPATAIVSAWQAVMRTDQLRRRGTR